MLFETKLLCSHLAASPSRYTVDAEGSKTVRYDCAAALPQRWLTAGSACREVRTDAHKRRPSLDASPPATPASACGEGRRRSLGDSAAAKLQTAPSADTGPNPLRGHPRRARRLGQLRPHCFVQVCMHEAGLMTFSQLLDALMAY